MRYDHAYHRLKSGSAKTFGFRYTFLLETMPTPILPPRSPG
jgi:hypothetical protein